LDVEYFLNVHLVLPRKTYF